MSKFEELGLNSEILKVIEEQKFEKPTEIQAKGIPVVLKGQDVIGGSATGSGKTLVFGSAIIHKVEKGKGTQALVLTPTRELAVQVAQEIKKFSRHKPMGIAMVYGGVGINPQIDKLRTSEVVVGTPGRILDHIERRTINLSRVRILVLDEADRMLDMGFIDDVERIIRQCPRERQTLLFSATIYPEIADIAKRYMINPIKISAEKYVDPSKMAQEYYDTPHNMKFSLLAHFMKHEHSGLVLIFCNTRRNTDFVAKALKSTGVKAMAIHGGFSQNNRTKALESLTSNRIQVLVCTDVAARGLDIKGVSHVYNYDIPKDSKEYVHRIGRTARAGEQGKVINILSERDYENFSRVLSDSQIKIAKKEMPHVEKVAVKTEGQGRRPFHRSNQHSMGGGRFGGSRQGGHHQGGGRYQGHHQGGSSYRGQQGEHSSYSRGGDREGGMTRSERRAREKGDY